MPREGETVRQGERESHEQRLRETNREKWKRHRKRDAEHRRWVEIQGQKERQT